MRAIYIIYLAFISFTNAQFCYQDIHTGCTFPNEQIQNCHARYSAVEHVVPDLQSYIMHHLHHSFQYLLMSTNFATYESNREGFAKLFRKFSDSTWDDAIDLIKYINKRGGNMDFNTPVPAEHDHGLNKNFNMFELESLSIALDMYKSLASKAHRIHSDVTRRREEYHDAETLSYMENKFVHKHADRIRELAGYSNDLSNMLLKGENPHLSLFLFDEYLHKQV
uniref:Ferritin n=1 Tax=Panstrongylus lignarius TaxID=156445 RepID=A0A224XW38_9HEMI